MAKLDRDTTVAAVGQAIWSLLGRPVLPARLRGRIARSIGNAGAGVSIDRGLSLRGTNLSLGKGCRIASDCTIEAYGLVVIGNETVIEQGVEIRSTRMLTVGDGDELQLAESVVIGNRCVIGRGARILPGSRITPGAHIPPGTVVRPPA